MSGCTRSTRCGLVTVAAKLSGSGCGPGGRAPSECPAITQTVDGQGQTRFVVFMDEDGLSCVLADVAEFRTALTVWAIAHGYAEQLIG